MMNQLSLTNGSRYWLTRKSNKDFMSQRKSRGPEESEDISILL
jgi:hypothetical protein